MIRMQKDGAELADKLAEIKRLRECENVRTAERMAQVCAVLDTELRQLRRCDREGEKLIEEGIDLAKLDEILRSCESKEAF